MRTSWSMLLQNFWHYGVVSCLLLYTILKLSGDFFLGSQPTPAVPPDGCVIYDPHIQLAWSSGDNVSTFHLQVAENGDFSKPAFSTMTSKTTAEITTLAPGKRYCWRVTDDAGARTACFYTSKIKLHY